MQNYTPILIFTTIFTGLITLLVYSNILIGSLRTYDYKEGERVQLVVDQPNEEGEIQSDTVKLRNEITSVTILNHQDESTFKSNLSLNFAPKTLIYIFFHAAYLAVSVVGMLIVLFLLWRMTIEFDLKRRFGKNILSIISIIVLAVLTGVLMTLTNSDSEYFMGGAKIMRNFKIIFEDPMGMVKTVMSSLTAVGLVLLCAIAYVNVVTSRISESEATNEEKLSRLKSLKGYMNTIAFLSGLIVAGTVVGTSLQRDMISEYLTNIDLIYPMRFIAVYGMVFTIILALFFIPSLLYLKYCERKYQPSSQGEEKKGWFGFGKETIKEIEIVFSVFLPLFASVVEYFIVT